MDEPEEPPRRLAPVQRRSRERMERILEVSAERIAEVGSDAMTMSEIARNCGISIGSLYQYFRDKGAILGALAERYHDATRSCIDDKLGSVATMKDFEAAFSELIWTYHAIFMGEPVIRDVWSGIAADKALQDVEVVNSRENGDRVAEHLLRVVPAADPARVRRAAFLVMALGEATMRLAIAVSEEEGRAHVDAYRRMALEELRRAATA